MGYTRMKQIFVRDRNFYKTMVRLSVPAALQALLSLLVMLADNVMVSRFDAAALAPVSQANSVSTFVIAQFGNTTREVSVHGLIVETCFCITLTVSDVIYIFHKQLYHFYLQIKRKTHKLCVFSISYICSYLFLISLKNSLT